MSTLFRNSSPSFSDFARTAGDPQEAKRKMDSLLDSGRITREQYDGALAQARQIMQLLGLVGKQ